LEKRVYFLVLLLLILIASFSIVSTLVMVVMEKRRDVAILKSIGATDRSVMKIFLIQGTVIGVAGILLGSILGYLGCLGLREYGFPLDEKVFSLSKLPVHMYPEHFVLVAVSALIITAAAGIYPALRAARLRPADALRFE
jgi:lipoprotein-releasing system permease protein